MGYCEVCGKETDQGLWKKVAVGSASSSGWGYGLGGSFGLGGSTTTFYEDRWVWRCPGCAWAFDRLQFVGAIALVLFVFGLWLGVMVISDLRSPPRKPAGVDPTEHDLKIIQQARNKEKPTQQAKATPEPEKKVGRRVDFSPTDLAETLGWLKEVTRDCQPSGNAIRDEDNKKAARTFVVGRLRSADVDWRLSVRSVGQDYVDFRPVRDIEGAALAEIRVWVWPKGQRPPETLIRGNNGTENGMWLSFKDRSLSQSLRQWAKGLIPGQEVAIKGRLENPALWFRVWNKTTAVLDVDVMDFVPN
jgi:hypothetical protein